VEGNKKYEESGRKWRNVEESEVVESGVEECGGKLRIVEKSGVKRRNVEEGGKWKNVEKCGGK